MFQHYREQQADPVATLAPVVPQHAQRPSPDASISGYLVVAQAVEYCSSLGIVHPNTLQRLMYPVHYIRQCWEET